MRIFSFLFFHSLIDLIMYYFHPRESPTVISNIRKIIYRFYMKFFFMNQKKFQGFGLGEIYSLASVVHVKYF